MEMNYFYTNFHLKDGFTAYEGEMIKGALTSFALGLYEAYHYAPHAQ